MAKLQELNLHLQYKAVPNTSLSCVSAENIMKYQSGCSKDEVFKDRFIWEVSVHRVTYDNFRAIQGEYSKTVPIFLIQLAKSTHQKWHP